MPFDETLAHRIRSLFEEGRVLPRGAVSEKKMFGGLTFLYNGHMCCGLAKGRMVVRVGPEAHGRCLAMPHTRPMNFTGTPMKGMVYVDLEGFKRAHQLRAWVQRGVDFVSSLPPKDGRGKKGAKSVKSFQKSTKEKPMPASSKSGGKPNGKFLGVPKQTLKFLKGLQNNNTKAWFEAHREDYDTHFADVAKELVEALSSPLEKLAPGVQCQPRINGSIFRPHRDLRFSKDKTPYKAHIDFIFWLGDKRGGQVPSFFLRIAPRQLVIGAGVHMPDKKGLSLYRAAVDDERRGKALERCVAKLEKAGYGISEPSRKKVPRGWDPDHSRGLLLRRDGITASWEGKLPAELHGPEFVKWCAGHYRAMLPLVRWWQETLAG